MNGPQGRSDASKDDVSADSLIEEKARALFREIRCLECGSGQSIEFSNAPAAVTLRDQIRNMLRNGMDKQMVRDYLTQEYGQRVWFQESSVFWTDPELRRFLIGGIVLGGVVGLAVLGVRGALPFPASPSRTVSKARLEQITRNINGPSWHWSAAEVRALRAFLSPPKPTSRHVPS
ncbi:hypothetical protein CCYA_CCYA02G0756 [Cyanidiococcus yangmingshanensis]|nr:hypothetical protein CCYA_CCYA02G0756 [Cyanidiococcus yangmingshanensis]